MERVRGVTKLVIFLGRNKCMTPYIAACKLSEAVAQRCSVKKVFLEISQNSKENTCARVPFLIKLQACNFI